MKRYLNYLLLASNVIMTILIAAVLGSFLKGLNNVNLSDMQMYNELRGVTWIVIAVLVFALSFGLFILYIFLLKKAIKESVKKINPRLEKGLIYSGLVALVNYTIPFALLFIGLYENNVENTTWILSFSFGISALVGLIIAGFTSYFNLRISWSNIKREQLEKEAIQENIPVEDEEYKHPKRSNIKSKSKSTSKEKQSETTKNDEATSGSF